MTGMTALPYGEPLTYDDLQRMPEDGHRYELVDGVLLVTPSPGAPHQSCVGELFALLRAARPSGVLVFVAPFDFVAGDLTVLEPDLMVMLRADVGDANTTVPPLLVVEVVSPSSRRTDHSIKRLAYADAGVPVYWIVDPAEPSLTALHLVDGRYVEVAHVTGDAAHDAELPYPVRVVPARLLDDLRE